MSPTGAAKVAGRASFLATSLGMGTHKAENFSNVTGVFKRCWKDRKQDKCPSGTNPTAVTEIQVIPAHSPLKRREKYSAMSWWVSEAESK